MTADALTPTMESVLLACLHAESSGGSVWPVGGRNPRVSWARDQYVPASTAYALQRRELVLIDGTLRLTDYGRSTAQRVQRWHERAARRRDEEIAAEREQDPTPSPNLRVVEGEWTPSAERVRSDPSTSGPAPAYSPLS